MIELTDNGTLRFEAASFPHRLALKITSGGTKWQSVPLRLVEANNYEATAHGAHIHLGFAPADNYWQYNLTLNSEKPTRVQLALELPEAADPYPIIPAVLFGDNNLDNVSRIVFPHLTANHREKENCAPYWEFRADRASHPIAITAFNGGVAAISIAPYCDNAEGIEGDDQPEFIRNGLFAQTAHDIAPQACGVTFGYRNTPKTYLNKTRFVDPTEHRLCRGSTTGTLHLAAAENRLAVHPVIRTIHQIYRDPAESTLTDQEGIELLRDGMTHVGWIEDGGNFADLKWDFENEKLITFRDTNDEIAWTGGTQTALPLLISGHRTGNQEAVDKALSVLDFIADPQSINPDSGWLWDVCSKTRGRSIHGWWTPIVGEAHCAYTNGEALAYLLEGYKYVHDEMQLDRPNWLETPLQVLDKAMEVQADDGNFGYGYSTGDGSMIDPDGFAGCWLNAALATAYELTGDSQYLEAAARGMKYYHLFVRDLCCWGTPMDTSKAIDQEGVLAFVRAARLLHQLTDEPEYLEMLGDGAEYEYLWRFVIRARPQEPPLKNSPWNSCGGSITSTSNPHIHPMGILISGDLQYLAEQTGDQYHQERMREGLGWALNCLELYPEHTDYGCPGVLTERFCPSDGLLIEKYPDGSPASVWFSYHVWGAANILEGLLDAGASTRNSDKAKQI